MAGGGLARILQAVSLGPLLSRIGNKKMRFFIAKMNGRDLRLLKDLLEAGKIVPVIDRRYPSNRISNSSIAQTRAVFRARLSGAWPQCSRAF
jgi:hypothetical protein